MKGCELVMAKLTAKEKEELLSLQQENLSVSEISKLFGKTTSKTPDNKFVINEPKFDLRKEFHLDKNEYINRDPVDTTVGIFLFNKLMIEGMIENIVPNGYYNEVINKKGFNKLVDYISEGLMMGKISVNPTLIKWLKNYEFYGMKLCTIFSPSYSEGLLRKNANVQKEKEKLLQKEIKTSTDMTDIEDSLVASSKKILKDDSGMTLFDSGARGSFDNDYKNMNLMVGPVAIPGRDGEFSMMTSNYIEGIQKKDWVSAGQIPVNSAFPKAKKFLSLFKS